MKGPADVKKAISILKRGYGKVGYFLNAETPLQILVATMLSAQTTDAQVNKTLPALFARYKNLHDFAGADIRELEGYIKSIGLYKTKARNIKNACRIIEGKYGSRVPDTMEALLELPGVGRKTANAVLPNAYGKIVGICIDTHCARLARRLGWTGEKDRVKIEFELMGKIPKEEWYNITYLLISHGRAICTARKPKCSECGLNRICPSAFME